MVHGNKIRVGIVFGGQSAEHEISILSARNILLALDRSRFDPVLIGVDKSGRWLEQDEARLLASAHDPRLVSIKPGASVQLPAVLAGQGPEAAGARSIDIMFYSYDAKYIDEHGAWLQLPARLSADESARAQALALRAFEVLECEGMARVDMFLRSDGELLINEINTTPGFTAISMYPKLWALSDVPPTELVTRLIDLGLERGHRRAAIRRSLG